MPTLIDFELNFFTGKRRLARSREGWLFASLNTASTAQKIYLSKDDGLTWALLGNNTSFGSALLWDYETLTLHVKSPWPWNYAAALRIQYNPATDTWTTEGASEYSFEAGINSGCSTLGRRKSTVNNKSLWDFFTAGQTTGIQRTAMFSENWSTPSPPSNPASNASMWWDDVETVQDSSRLDCRHAGDGYVPAYNEVYHAHVSAATREIRFARYYYDTSWNKSTIRVINPGQPLINHGAPDPAWNAKIAFDAKFTGTQFSMVGVYNDGSGPRVKLWERNVSDTVTTSYTAPVISGYPTLADVTLAYDSDNNIYIAAVIDLGGGMRLIKFDRSTASFGTWSTISNTGVRYLNLAPGIGDVQALYVVPDSGGNLGYSNRFLDIANPPTQPLWLTTITAAQATSPLTLQWRYTDPDPTDVQAKYVLRRTIAGVVRYWDAGLSSWVVGEVANTTASTSVTLPSAWANLGDAVDFAVKTYDATNLSSPFSANLRINAAAKVNPVITDPAAGLYASTSVTLKWTCADQSAYKVDLKTPTASVYSSGWVLNGLDRQFTIPISLTRATSYTISLTTRSALGLDSDTQERSIDVLYDAPATPSFNVVTHYVSGKPAALRLYGQVDNKGVQASLLEYYRRVVGTTGSGVLVGTSPNPGSHIDWSVASNVDYEYRCAAVSSVGVRAFSAWRDGSSAPQGGALSASVPIAWDTNSVTGYSGFTSLPNVGTGSTAATGSLTTGGGTTYIQPFPPPKTPVLVCNQTNYWYSARYQDSIFLNPQANDWEMVVRFARVDWTAQTSNYIFNVSGSTTPMMGLQSLQNGGVRVLLYSSSGVSYTSPTYTLPSLVAGVPKWVRVRFTYSDVDSLLNRLDLFYANDSETLPSTWTTLGTVYSPYLGLQLQSLAGSVGQFAYLGYATNDVTEAKDQSAVIYYAKFCRQHYTNPDAAFWFNPSATDSLGPERDQFIDSAGAMWERLAISNVDGPGGGINHRGGIILEGHSTTTTGVTASNANLTDLNLENSFTILVAGQGPMASAVRDVLTKCTSAGQPGIAIQQNRANSRTDITLTDSNLISNQVIFDNGMGRNVEPFAATTYGLTREKETYSFAQGTWNVANPNNSTTLGQDGWWIFDISQTDALVGTHIFAQQVINASNQITFAFSVTSGVRSLVVSRTTAGVASTATTTLDPANQNQRLQIRVSHDANFNFIQNIWRVWVRPDNGNWTLLNTVRSNGTINSWSTPSTPPVYQLGNGTAFANNADIARLYGFQYGSGIDVDGNPTSAPIINVDFHNQATAVTQFKASSGQEVVSAGSGTGAGVLGFRSDWISGTVMGRRNQNNRVNLVSNPSFENGVSSGWTLTTAGVTPTWRRAVGESIAGTSSGFMFSTTGAGTGSSYMYVETPFINISANLPYTISAYIKPTALVYARVALYYYNSSNVYLDGTGASNNQYQPNVWARISRTYVAPSTAVKAKVFLLFDYVSANTGVYWDAVLFEQSSFALDYFDGEVYLSPTSPVDSYRTSWAGYPHQSQSNGFPIDLLDGVRSFRIPTTVTGSVTNTEPLWLFRNQSGTFFKGFLYANRALTDDEIVGYHKFAHGIT